MDFNIDIQNNNAQRTDPAYLFVTGRLLETFDPVVHYALDSHREEVTAQCVCPQRTCCFYLVTISGTLIQ